MKNVLICGAGGFIGGHMVKSLLADGVTNIRAVDIKPFDGWYQKFPEVENVKLDLEKKANCEAVCSEIDTVFNFAANMGGMGFIEKNKALCMLSVLINTHLLASAQNKGVKRYFYSSSACVYNADKQKDPNLLSLKEEDAYPAMPEDGYGWEKLFSERMCRHFREDFGLETRVARYHNVYGPFGTWRGGREKVPAAICRKIIDAKLSGKNEIEIWGDGEQTRSFTFIDDCIKGTKMLMASNFCDPLNIGSAEKVSINQLVDIVEEIANIKLTRTYLLSAPKGVNGRNSDNTLIKQALGWAPSVTLREGMKKTYDWILKEIENGSTVGYD